MKDISGYEGIYAVTSDGRVWSYPREWDIRNGAKRSHTGKFLKPWLTGNKGYQYLTVELSSGGKKKNHRVHVLVAMAFVDNPLGLPQVNHIDANRLNNHCSNLEWCNQKQNSQHAFKMGLMKQFYGEDHNGHKLSTQQIEDIRIKKTQGHTLKQLSEEYHSSISNISYICRRETRIYG